MKASDIRKLLTEWEGNDLLEQLDQYGYIPDILEDLVLEVEKLEKVIIDTCMTAKDGRSWWKINEAAVACDAGLTKEFRAAWDEKWKKNEK